MTNKPIVGVLAGLTRDHILLEGLPLHITLCERDPGGRVIFEAAGGRGSLKYVMEIWEQSNRKCIWCEKKLAKRKRRDS